MLAIGHNSRGWFLHGLIQLSRNLRIIHIRNIHTLVFLLLVHPPAAESRMLKIIMHDSILSVVLAETTLAIRRTNKIVLLNLEVVYLPLVHFFQHLLLLLLRFCCYCGQ